MAIGPTQLILILVIVLLLFGTKRLKNMGGDLGGAIKGFRKAMADDKPETLEKTENGQTFDAKAQKVEDNHKA